MIFIAQCAISSAVGVVGVVGANSGQLSMIFIAQCATSSAVGVVWVVGVVGVVCANSGKWRPL